MTTHPRNRILDDPTTAALRGLDAARVDDDVVTGPGAQGALSRILATGHAVPAEPRRRAGRRHTGRWVAAGVVVLAGGLVAAVNLDRDSPSRAYASWTPTPAASSRQHAAETAAACRRSARESLGHTDDPGVPPDARAGMPTTADVAAARVVLAETRGDWTMVSIAGRGVDMTCLSHGTDGSRVDMASGALGGGDVTVLPASNAFVSGGIGVGSTPEGSFSHITGTVGRDVTGLTVTTADGRRVKATISDDHFAAWWPGSPIPAPTGGIDDTPPEQVTVDLTLRDGTVRRGLPGSTIASGGDVVTRRSDAADGQGSVVRGRTESRTSGGGVAIP